MPAAPAGERAGRTAAWRPLPVRPPAAGVSASPVRGPAWFVALLDFVERATGRTTSLREHLTMFIVYALVIVGVPAGLSAYVVVKIVSMGTWPGMTSIVVVAASAGGAVFIKRWGRTADASAGEDAGDSEPRATPPEVSV